MRTISFVSYRKKQRTSFFIAAFFIGIVIGASFVSFVPVKDTEWLYQYLRGCHDGEIKIFLINSCVLSVLYTLTAFLIGLSVFGQAGGFILLVYRGLGVGASVSYMYLSAVKKDVLPLLIGIFTRSFIVLFISAIVIRECIYASRYVISCCLGKNVINNERFSFKLYCLRFTVIVSLLLFFSAVDGVIMFFSCIKR